MGEKSAAPEGSPSPSSSPPQEEAGEEVETATAGPQRPARRAVYVTRVDTDGGSGHIVTGADYAIGTATAGKPRTPSSSAPNKQESATDRWLRENIPPHW